MSDIPNRDEIKSALIKVAAELVTGKGLPPEFANDWDVNFSIRARHKVQAEMDRTRKKCCQWARIIKAMADRI